MPAAIRYRVLSATSPGQGSTAPLGVDPKEKLVTGLMQQSPRQHNVEIWRQTRTMVYQAMID
jgi:hypothetical protein